MCDCTTYTDLELMRKQVSARAKVTPRISKGLENIAEHPGGEHRLLRCPECGQLWQSSSAWNWGAARYVFKVPEVPVQEWCALPFVQPDELLIYSATVGKAYETLQLDPADVPCKSEGCSEPRVLLSLHCRRHHIKALQQARILPPDPFGRWFAPYVQLAV